MKQAHKYAAGVIASLGLGLAIATAYAHPGQMDGETGHGMKGSMQHGVKGGMQHGGMSGGAGHGAGQQLMTPEERTALREKMRNAKSPEERQQIAAANRAEMQKRAKEKGVTLHEGHGHRRGTTPQAPATTEHQH